MSHLFLTLSLGSGRVLTCSQFDLALFLRRCLLFALLQAASMRTSDLTQLLCGLFGRSQRTGPVTKAPPKLLAPSKDCVSFVFNYTTPQMLKQTLTPNQLICEVSPDENKRSMMETLLERLQNVSLVFITHTVFPQLLFNLLICGRHASSPVYILEERASSCSLCAFKRSGSVFLSQRE